VSRGGPVSDDARIGEWFRIVAEHMRDVFWIRPVDGMRFHFVNPAYERIWGVPPETLYADPQSWLRQVLPEYREHVRQVFEQPVAPGGGWEFEYPIRRADGKIRWIRSRGFRVASRNGADLLLGLCEDVTERRLGEARQRSNLIREVHHRIKNNLQGVVGLLGMHASRSPECAPYLREAIGQVSAIATIHGLHAQPGAVNVRLCDVLEAVARAVQELHGARIMVQVPPERHVVLSEGEAVAIALVVHELLTNAVKHRDRAAGEPVRALLSRGGKAVTLRVTNPGRMPEGFDFASGAGSGAGLGLVRSLLPLEGAALKIGQRGADIEATLELRAPVLAQAS
jgi:PAS domain S-box-containing protein